ncbi:MAG TPA: hypothetical protein VKB88_14870 [Bryobacteraceae bacterium]|nr:hypothetical protein [Bryobacteraceae bacterium]
MAWPAGIPFPEPYNGKKARATRETVAAAVNTAPEALAMAMTRNVVF